MVRRPYIVLLLLCLLPTDAKAIKHSEGTLAGECAWASVVNVGEVCTGTLITPNHVLFAAHCSTYGVAHFGETDLEGNGAVETVNLVNCVAHDDWNHALGTGNTGVDLAICEVDDLTPAPAVPIVPQMVPTGPARDWLRELVYSAPSTAESDALVTLVGTGCNEGSDIDSCTGDEGWKYELDPAVVGNTVLRRQTTDSQTHTKLHIVTVDTNAQRIMGGDSGGPTFVQFRDGSWRQIGVHHSDQVYDEATPPYLTWIEAQAGDVTPCHEFDGEEWVWVGDCSGEFPTNPGASYDTWTNDCAGVTYGGGLNPFGTGTTQLPLLADQDQPFPGEGLPWASIADFEAAYATALFMAQSGAFGEIPVKANIADWFIEEIEPDATHPYLGTIKRAGIEGAYAEIALEADFDGDSLPDTLYADPYHDCGKGRIIIILDDGSASEWDRDTTGVLGSATCSAHFGAAVAVGDFDGDGYDDVAITAPGATVSSQEQAGDLSVLYGSVTGLTESGDQWLSQDSSGILDAAEAHDFFGESMVAADFDCDGYVDVAIGAPRDDYSTTLDAGMVHVIHGSSGGLSTVNSIWFQVGSVNGTVESGDHFGSSLAAGNFNGDVNSSNGKECMDLAIGAPGEDLGSPAISDAGFVYVALGGSSGLTSTGDLELHQDVAGVADAEEADDRFGAVLEAVDDGTYWGLVVQVPGEACSGISENVGLHRFYGSSTGLTTTSNTLSCEEFDHPFNSRDSGILTQLADYYSIRVLAEL